MNVTLEAIFRIQNIKNVNTSSLFQAQRVFSALDTVVIDLRLRFGEEQKRAAKLGMLIPANMNSDWEKDFKLLQQDVLDLYLDLLTEPIATVKAEYKLWHLQWSNAEEKPQTALSFPAISSPL